MVTFKKSLLAKFLKGELKKKPSVSKVKKKIKSKVTLKKAKVKPKFKFKLQPPTVEQVARTFRSRQQRLADKLARTPKATPVTKFRAQKIARRIKSKQVAEEFPSFLAEEKARRGLK